MAAIQRGNATGRSRKAAPDALESGGAPSAGLIVGTSIPARTPSADAVYTGAVAVPRSDAVAVSAATSPAAVTAPAPSAGSLPLASIASGGVPFMFGGDEINLSVSSPGNQGSTATKPATTAPAPAGTMNWFPLVIVGAVLLVLMGKR